MSGILRHTFIAILLFSATNLVGGCALPGASGGAPSAGIRGDNELIGQDHLWEVHSRAMRELPY